MNKMESHEPSFTIIKEDKKTLLIFENGKFVYSVPQADGSLLYKCVIDKCLARVKIDKKTKTKVTGGHFIHSNHEVRPPVKKVSINKAETPKMKPTKGTKVINTVGNSETPLPHPATPTQQAASIPPPPPPTPPKFNEETFSHSEPGCCFLVKKQLHKALGEIDELKILRDSLIDKIMEKEKVIISLTENPPSAIPTNHQSDSKRSSHKDFNKSTRSKPNPAKQRCGSERTSEPNPKCHLVGDSHVRALGQCLREEHGKYVEANFKPGAGFEVIQDTSPINLESNTPQNIVIFCGTNDVESSDWSKVKQAVSNIINKYKDHYLSFILVPIRWDRPYINTRVAQFNSMLRKVFRDQTISYLDPNFYLRPWHYARDGVHMNKKGKRLICLKIKSQLLERTQVLKPEIQPVRLNPSNNRSYSNVCSTPQIPSTTNIGISHYSDVSAILPSANTYCNVDNSVWSPMYITTVSRDRPDNTRNSNSNFYSNPVSTKRT